jgi:hypothetical protein
LLRAVVPPIVAAYALFVAMVLLARRRPVSRPGRSRAMTSATRGDLIRTIVGGYGVFLVIVLVFHVWLAGERDGIVDAIWGGAVLSLLAGAMAVASWVTHRSPR